jgi:hypothetical protein
MLMRLWQHLFNLTFVASKKNKQKPLQLQHKKTAMKKITIITTAFLLIGAVSAFAAKKKSRPFVVEKEFYQLSFSKIVVENDIELRLAESTEKVIETWGDSRYTKEVEWKIKNGVLYIRSKAGSLKNKARVNVNVNQLSSLLVTGNSDVKSEGALNSANLNIFVDGEGKIAIKNTGAINIERADAIGLDILRVSGNVSVDFNR